MHEVNREPGPTTERLRELLADRALFGLDAAEERELAGLLRDHPAEDADALDRIAAAAALATGATAQLPDALRARRRRWRSISRRRAIIATNVASDDTAGSNRAACRQTSMNTSCTPSSASSRLGDIFNANDQTIPPYSAMHASIASLRPAATSARIPVRGMMRLVRSRWARWYETEHIPPGSRPDAEDAHGFAGRRAADAGQKRSKTAHT